MLSRSIRILTRLFVLCRLSTYLSRTDHHSVVSGFAETLLSPQPSGPGLTYQTPSGLVSRSGVAVQQELQNAVRRSRSTRSTDAKQKDASTDTVALVDRETETGRLQYVVWGSYD